MFDFCLFVILLNKRNPHDRQHTQYTLDKKRHETPVLDHPIKIIHLDDDLIVLDKPCSVPVSNYCSIHIRSPPHFTIQQKSTIVSVDEWKNCFKSQLSQYICSELCVTREKGIYFAHSGRKQLNTNKLVYDVLVLITVATGRSLPTHTHTPSFVHIM